MGRFERSLMLGVAVAAAIAAPAYAQSSFCAGWESGWRAAFENRGMMVAMTPMCPMPRMGGDSYDAGFERGMVAALGYIAQRR